MDGNINHPIWRFGSVIPCGDALTCLTGPAGFNPISRDVAAVDQRVSHGIRTQMRQVHVVIRAADGVGFADDCGNLLWMLHEVSVTSATVDCPRASSAWLLLVNWI